MGKISAHEKISGRTVQDAHKPAADEILEKRILINGNKRIRGKSIIGHAAQIRAGAAHIKTENAAVEDSTYRHDNPDWTAGQKKQQLKNLLYERTKKLKNELQKDQDLHEEDETTLYYEKINDAKNHLIKTAGNKVTKRVLVQREQRSYYEQYKKEYFKKDGYKNQKKKELKKLKEAAKKKAKTKAAEKATAKKLAAAAGKAAGTALSSVLIVALIIAVVTITDTGTILALTLSFYAPIPSSDGDGTEGEIIPEEDAEVFLRAYIPELRDDYVAALQAREAELRAEGYNHIVIYNLLGISLGGDDNVDGSSSVIPGNITDPDCGILSEEDYVQMLRMVFVPCLLAKYDTSYNNTQAKEVAKECFNLITYRVEYPQNVDSNGVVNYVYCDGACRPDNEYSCYAFYRDASGRSHAWPGCGGKCWNCSPWMQHDNPDADAYSCCETRTRCPGHPVEEGGEAKFYHSNVGYCSNPVQYSVCNGYRICYGHKEMNIVIGTGSAEDLLQEYFLNRIEELESLENLTEEQLAELSALKNYYEIAKTALESNIY